MEKMSICIRIYVYGYFFWKRVRTVIISFNRSRSGYIQSLLKIPRKNFMSSTLKIKKKNKKYVYIFKSHYIRCFFEAIKKNICILSMLLKTSISYKLFRNYSVNNWTYWCRCFSKFTAVRHFCVIKKNFTCQSHLGRFAR